MIDVEPIEDDEIFQLNKLSWLHDGNKVIFCKTDFLGNDFINIARNQNKVVLITGNSDYGVTEQVADAMPENIHHWFCTNNLTNNKRITSIPLGMENSFEAARRGHGKGWNHAIEKRDILSSNFRNKNDNTEGLIYSNFTINTNSSWRSRVAEACDKSEFINHDQNQTKPNEFYSKILAHKMVVCPLGNAPQGQADNHRIYETLYCNRVPIVFSTDQNILYESIYSKLPVVILDGVEDLYDKDKILKLYQDVKDKPNDIIKHSFWKKQILQKVSEI